MMTIINIHVNLHATLLQNSRCYKISTILNKRTKLDFLQVFQLPHIYVGTDPHFIKHTNNKHFTDTAIQSMLAL